MSTTTQIGKIGFVLKGAWNSTTVYNNLDVVLYNNNSYAAKGTVPVNTNPTNTTYWQKITDVSSLPNSNINLLTNAYFFGKGSHVSGEYFPLNTLGKNLYDGTGNDCIDNWMVKGSAAQFRFSSGWASPHIRSTTTNLDGAIRQKLPYILPNGTYTFSALVQNQVASGEGASSVTINRVYIAIRDQNNNTLSNYSSSTTGIQLLTTTFTQNYSTENPVYIGSVEIGTRAITTDTEIRNTVSKDIALRAAKLELGNQQTLAYNNNNSWELIEIPTYKNTLTTTKFNNTWDIHTRGKIIFMGNSYTDNSDSWRSWDHWPRHVARILGLGEENVNWWNIGAKSWSLVGVNGEAKFILKLQQWVTQHPNNISEIGAIVLVAGVNDARDARIPSLDTCFSQLATYIKNTFPNATYYDGYCGWINEQTRSNDNPASGGHGNHIQMTKVLNAYINAQNYGWKYLNGVENIFHNKDLFATKSNGNPDHIHPNALGQQKIGEGVANALMTGSCSVSGVNSFDLETIVCTADDGNYQVQQANTGGYILESINNNMVYTTLYNLDYYIRSTSSMSSYANVTFTKGNTYILGNAPLKYSNYVEFGEVLAQITEYDSGNKHSDVLLHVFINNGQLVIQIRDFLDGAETKIIRRIWRFANNTTNLTMND